LHDRQAAGALVAAVGRACVAEERVADTTGAHGVRECRRRDELVALAVGEDQHRAPVAGDQRARLGRRADGDLVDGAVGMRAQVGRQRCDARRRHGPGAAGHLDAIAHRGDRGGQRKGEDRAQRRDARDAHRPRPCANGERDARPQAGRDGGIDAGQVARAQARHRAAEDEADDEPEPEGEQPTAGEATQPARPAERQGDGERGQRGDRLDPDPPPQVGLS
jgi:hypothetical protein